MRSARSRGLYVVGAALVIAAYISVTWTMWSNHSWTSNGPLAKTAPDVWSPEFLDPTLVAQQLCDYRSVPADRVLVRGAIYRNHIYYACYELSTDRTVNDAVVIDARGGVIHDTGLIKKLGAWKWMGLVKTVGDLIAGGVAVLFTCTFWFMYYRPRRPGEKSPTPWWQRDRALLIWAAVPILGWFVLAKAPAERPRKIRALYRAAAFYTALVLLLASGGGDIDALGAFVVVTLAVAYLYGVIGGRLLMAPAGFGGPVDWSGPLPSTSVKRPVTQPDVQSPFRVERPETLPNFTDVGGMDALKAELRETIGLVLAYSGEAEKYRLTWNGILLHGRPGVGKTFIARATAGEFGMNFVQISAGDLVSAYRGESSRNVSDAFEFAARNIPCILFLDEFDSIAQNRDDWPDQEARRTVNQLLETLVEFRSVRDLVVMAATNNLDQLDPAVVRPGRFDRLIRVDLPDETARSSIFTACLRGRPAAKDIDCGQLAQKSAGMTPAAIARTVERAAMNALHRTTSSGHLSAINQSDLLDALTAGGAQDRPSIDDARWEDLVLPEDVLAELEELQVLISDPDSASAMGVEPPTGLLLTGPPGTGKTTIAKVLAAQARCSFYPITAADITSMWLGQSEKSIQRLFDRARDNRPSIVFIDEIDAVASKRGEWGSYDRQVNELLLQIDGLAGHRGVFVIATTNRPDQLDPALTRGGRLSRTIEIPLPDRAARLKLLQLFTKRMPLQSVDLDALADDTDGASGADLKALCQQAALHALVRLHEDAGKAHTVLDRDFTEALDDWRQGRSVATR